MTNELINKNQDKFKDLSATVEMTAVLTCGLFRLPTNEQITNELMTNEPMTSELMK